MKYIAMITSKAVYGAAAVMGFVFLGVTLNIILRLLGHSIYGFEELISYMMPWIIFLSIPYGIREGREIDIDLLYNLFPPNLKRRISVVMYILMAITMFAAAIAGYKLVLSSLKYSWITCQLMMPVWPWQVCMPVGFLFMAIESLDFALRIRKGVVTL